MQQPHPAACAALDFWPPSALVEKVENSFLREALPHFGQTGFSDPLMSNSERAAHASQVYSYSGIVHKNWRIAARMASDSVTYTLLR
jgi:hypothetical protein